MNPLSGIIEMQLGDQKVLSTKIFSQQNVNLQSNDASKPFYVGTELHARINTHLETQIKHDISVAEFFRSKQNQKSFQAISIGVIGPGRVFGDVDAYHTRPNTYSLVAKTLQAELLVMPAATFKSLIDANDSKFGRYSMQTDKLWANKLAEAINNYKLI